MRNESIQKVAMAAGAVAAANQAKMDVRGLTAISVYAECTAGTSFSFLLEGTTDPLGLKGWATLAFREAGGGAYGVVAKVVSAPNGMSTYLGPDDNVIWVRMVTSAPVGSPFGYGYLHAETL